MTGHAFLEMIVDCKRKQIARRKAAVALAPMRECAARAAPARDFQAALRQPGIALIAEVKRASPSKGLLCRDFQPLRLARQYQAAGAAAISVLTEKRFFKGCLDHLRAVQRSSRLPILCKDFILDPYQIYEARAAGADAVLLIVAVLCDADLRALLRLARDQGMDALVEVHDEGELERALAVGAQIIGINNRDLQSMRVSLEKTVSLRPLIPAGVVVVSESGIRSGAEVARLKTVGVDAILVGEALVCALNVEAKVKELLA